LVWEGFLRTGGKFLIWLAFLSRASFAADFVQVSMDSSNANPDTGTPDRQVEVMVIEPGPGDTVSTPSAILSAQMQLALESNPNAQMAVLCASSPACAPVQQELASVAPLSNVPFQTVAPAAVVEREAVAAESVASVTANTKGRPSDWKGQITVIRILLNGLVTGLTAIYDPHTAASMWQGVGVGATSGGVTGFRSYYNTPLLNWNAHERWTTSEPPDPAKGEVSNPATKIYKRALISGVTNAFLAASYLAVGIDHSGGDWKTITWKWALSIATSLATQLPWEVVNQRWTEAAVRRDPLNAGLYHRYSGFGSLAQNAASRITGGLTLGGGVLGTVLAGIIGGSGFIAATWKYAPERFRQRVADAGTAIRNGACTAWRALAPKPRGSEP